MKTKTAYVIRTGTLYDGRSISSKLRDRRGVGPALRAARRMGFVEAYAAKMSVAAGCRLKTAAKKTLK